MTVAIGIVGCAGRMGRMVIQEVLATEGCILAGGTEMSGGHIGSDLGSLVGMDPVGVSVGDDPHALFSSSDVVIDFTVPAATRLHAAAAEKTGTAYVVGTTGLAPDDQAVIDSAAQKVPTVQAPNFSVGVNLLFALTKQVAAKLGTDYDIEVLEMHHRHKVDAPSGTALGIGQAAAAGRDVPLDDVARYAREGQTGPRATGEIGFATLRGGGVIGDHTVMFSNEAERLEVTHKASSRGIFAGGAVRAALWLQGKDPGLYGMADVLGLD
ncbi:MAG: 4-hydroxy-tetrahydrodipicolinate reductase [Rhodospirillaceae bacterium]|jgi:4-hydroxy-tetrahydrodipicolinate reductase|nr:4-hydroxy-tetrahydrodipicolinate reductase [Rhodospirillaceae bacterium]MBT5240827.1 4-hydroxy-tetrahydrodipicolinate reductase [Rhodospirillaceae bacterium]MBT5564703.1 4-hydroxy-tetrahydrodipicolinate reductase [Rhodospirillaceae bacterium]MBT6090164.1 4-hydroxy-tetrahydrodipicolinate reductase [Rhodospirillaceae bacterium]MBT6962422.1 4-hydroxy-tetrahydrodipicolinate reductase [Rhodospirillaceae bacterium]